jgi:pSer/pThr/pTyr-binding forkhead associated (FHA) protein
MWKLVIEDDEGKRTVVPLTRDEYSIGRQDRNTIRLTERNVSRTHARIVKLADPTDSGRVHFMVEDLTSYNGVYVNGLRVASSQELTHGDLVQIGDYRVVIQDESITDIPPSSVITADLKSTIPQRNRGSELLERPDRLVMLAGPTPGAEYPLSTQKIVIGRAEEADISVNHNSVSRIHCEIHALGEGRFEIVDKGSSNGIHVNAAELRRGIIEAGDVIELGDVKFKFVGAGQVFRPGATESQQLSAIGDRTATGLVANGRAFQLLPYVSFGICFLIAAVVYVQYGRPPEAPPVSPEAQFLADSRAICEQSDCLSVRDKVEGDLPQSSSLRRSEAYFAIQNRWADTMLQLAAQEPDLVKRQAMLVRVAEASTVEESRRKTASEASRTLETVLKAQERVADATPTETPGPPPDGVPAPRPATQAPAPNSDNGTAPPKPPAITTPKVRPEGDPPKPPPAPTSGETSELSKVRELLGHGDEASMAQARKILEPKVFGNRATPQEIDALYKICKAMHDPTCQAAVRPKLSK